MGQAMETIESMSQKTAALKEPSTSDEVLESARKSEDMAKYAMKEDLSKVIKHIMSKIDTNSKELMQLVTLVTDNVETALQATSNNKETSLGENYKKQIKKLQDEMEKRYEHIFEEMKTMSENGGGSSSQSE